ncbi:GtrA family protein [Clostridium cochlearium]|uniref:GtrA family protein n=1 Tax=Clostridium cochlearium TaxID=1494 RepID=UPI000B9483E1|nr:GtrA family protein [Clostridium cochlearium]MBU5269602.1 GtrA family protein [Clostridium cochlearium]SNV82102.1 GtrA family protein [Clostridium cochlearium]STA92988.1 GtrA family protein [Clostridium cochlearium]
MNLKDNIKQFILYALIGSSNVVIDFCILNMLWMVTGIYKGAANILFKFISFIFYSLNGYYWNKKYTFKTEGSFLKFASVLGIAAIINSIILSIMSIYNILGISDLLWSNICALTASIITGIGSFLINKLYIFKKVA